MSGSEDALSTHRGSGPAQPQLPLRLEAVNPKPVQEDSADWQTTVFETVFVKGVPVGIKSESLDSTYYPSEHSRDDQGRVGAVIVKEELDCGSYVLPDYTWQSPESVEEGHRFPNDARGRQGQPGVFTAVHKQEENGDGRSELPNPICSRVESAGKSLSWQRNLEKHIVCGDCGKSFSQQGHLNIHSRTHTGERPFSCRQCGKSFSVQGNLRKHFRTHTGERPFACGDCGQGFSEQGTLKRHRRTHTGERPFVCVECGKSFSKQDHLNLHTRTHTGERPFDCAECGKSFRDQSYLKKHRRTHTGERPFVCGECGKSFSEKGNLKKHSTMHSK